MIIFFTIILNLISAVFLYFTLQFNWWLGFNLILFLSWLLSLTFISEVILARIFSLSKTYTRFLSLFLNIILLGFISNIFTSWWAYNNLAFLISLVITSFVIIFWSYFFKKLESQPKIYLGNNDGWINFKNWYLWLFLAVTIIGFRLIALAQTGNYLISPWQVLSSSYLIFVFIALLIIFSLVFSKKKVWLVLAVIIIGSFLMHSYLLVYASGFGGDRWRHLGSENRILQGMIYQPTLLTDDIWYQSVAGISVPRALIAGPKISYGFEWSWAVIIAKVSGSDIFTIDKFLILFLWSLFLPLIVFVWAWQLKVKKNLALLASALTLIFYLLQYYGSQTLPISFSVLYFGFLMAGFLAYLKNKQNTILAFLIFLTVLSYFGYLLAFIILILALVWLLTMNLKPGKKYFMVLVLSLTIWGAEIMSGFSTLTDKFSMLKITNAIIGGNFLFFEKGKFLLWDIKYWPILSLIISLFFLASIFIFSWKMLKEKKAEHLFLIGLTSILIINYFLSWILLDGIHSLARRLNVYIVLLLVFILAYGLSNFINNRRRARVVIIALSLVGSLVYVSGPVLEATVTTSDAQSMQYIWSQVVSEPHNYCVLADTWPLLAMEAYSAKEIKAGNFASDFNYQQNDRVRIFSDFVTKPSLDTASEALKVTNTKACFIMINYNILNQEKIYQINNLFGQPKIFGDNLVWEYITEENNKIIK